MIKLSFKDYYESKKLLTENSQNIITFSTNHTLYKYCKVPFRLDENKVYIPFKPRDIILIEWERLGEEINPKKFIISEKIYVPMWNPSKMRTWIIQSSTQNIETSNKLFQI